MLIIDFLSYKHDVNAHITYLRYHMGSASLVILSFAFIIFFI